MIGIGVHYFGEMKKYKRKIRQNRFTWSMYLFFIFICPRSLRYNTVYSHKSTNRRFTKLFFLFE